MAGVSEILAEGAAERNGRPEPNLRRYAQGSWPERKSHAPSVPDRQLEALIMQAAGYSSSCSTSRTLAKLNSSSRHSHPR